MADIISGKSRFSGSNNSGSGKNIIKLPGAINEEYKEYVDRETSEKIKRHRRNRIIIGVIALAVVIAAAVVIYNSLDGITYSSYSIVSSVNRDDTESARYIEYGDGYIRYSDDGIAYFDSANTSIWNQTYSMQKPQVKICDSCVAVGDINGSKIYVFNKSGMLGSIDASLSISQIEVAKQGVVAAVLEDNTANYINLYDTAGNKIYSVKTTLKGDGYPLDISISDDATKLMASYLYVSGETMKTNVVFYNFSEVGQNETERVVGGFNHYDSTIVGDVEFMADNKAVAVGENVVSIYTIKEYPSLTKEIQIDNEIERVFFSDEYIGLVLKNSESGDLYKLVVYNLSGSKVCEHTFNTEYDSIKFDGKSVLFSNGSTFALMNFSGKVLTTQTSELSLDTLLSTGKRGGYILINSKYIQNIKLK